MELVKLYPKIKKDEEEAFEILTNSDPTKNKQYLQWILVKGISEWKNKNLKLFKEDLPKITEALDRFENLKKVNKLKPTEKDINKFKNFSELFEMLQQYPTEEELSNKAKKKELEEQFFTKKQATLVHNDSTWKIVIPHTKEASCYFGVNTQWCTAAKNNNAFNEYNKDGNLYIILHKASNKRWQFHLESNQFMDEKDREVIFNEFNKKYPEVFGKHIVFSEKVQLEAVKENGWAIQYIKNPSEKLQLEAVKQNGYVIRYIKNPSEKLQLEAVKQDGLAIKFIKNPSKKVQLEAEKNR
ncbi:MAG TPA: DUF4116 domain-containing protein [Candidatus Woesebacteria bacterium]|nr:DUF4116 domain-containing protein [Candidatus Woesebacteria bacterium]